MNAAQFWLIVVVVALLAAAALGVRRLLRDRADGLGPVGAVRSFVESRRGIPSLDVLPHTLVDRAVRAARPIPSGRALPEIYHLRCGTEIYVATNPYAAELAQTFADGLEEVAARNLWRFQPPYFVVELDESLTPNGYRFDCSFPDAGRSPTGRGKVTDFFVPQQPGPQQRHRQRASTARNSEWVVLAPGRRPKAVPSDGGMTIGADAKCGVVLDNHYVSGVHVTLTPVGADLVISDGDGNGRRSRNGTKVNGHGVSTLRLTGASGDARLQIGPEITLTIARGAPTVPIS